MSRPHPGEEPGSGDRAPHQYAAGTDIPLRRIPPADGVDDQPDGPDRTSHGEDGGDDDVSM